MLHNCCFTNSGVSVAVSQKKVCLLSPESANAQEAALTTPACTSDAAGLGFSTQTVSGFSILQPWAAPLESPHHKSLWGNQLCSSLSVAASDFSSH